MAVVQISKIQLRRGKKLESGLPQLASGEMAWAIDTQELYIGNGSVGEGAPAVGNTKILTERDNILDLLQSYQYKPTDTSIETGINGNVVARSLQERLDEGRVNAASFGISGTDPLVDQTEKIQNALFSLYLTTTTNNRVGLEFDPGIYRITGTLYIPSNVRIYGSGVGSYRVIGDEKVWKSGTIFKFIKGAVNYNTTLTPSGTRNTTSAGTYTDIGVTNVSSSGNGLVVDITTTGAGASYNSGNTFITIVSSGSGYADGDTVRIDGSLVGGTSGTNDITITLSNEESASSGYPTFDTNVVFEFINDFSTRTTKNASTTDSINQAKTILLQDFTVETVNDDILVLNLTDVKESEFKNLSCYGTWEPNNLAALENSVAIFMESLDAVTENNVFENVHTNGFTYGVFATTELTSKNSFDRCHFQSHHKGASFGAANTANPDDAVSDAGPTKNTLTNCVFEDINYYGIYVRKGYGNRSRGNTFINVGNEQSGNNNALWGQIKFSTPGNSSVNDNFDRSNPYNNTVDLARNRFTTQAYVPEVEGYAYRHETTPAKITLASNSPSTLVAAFRLPLNDASGFEVKYVFRNNDAEQMRRGTMYIAVDPSRLNDNDYVPLSDEYEYLGEAGAETDLVFFAKVRIADGVKSVVVYYTSSDIGTSNSFTYTYNELHSIV